MAVCCNLVPVKEYAVSQGLRILQPEKLKDEAFIEELRSLQADLQIVVAFRMLPEIVWNMPRLGTFNLPMHLYYLNMRSCSYKLGGDKRRYGNWYYDFFLET